MYDIVLSTVWSDSSYGYLSARNDAPFASGSEYLNPGVASELTDALRAMTASASAVAPADWPVRDFGRVQLGVVAAREGAP